MLRRRLLRWRHLLLLLRQAGRRLRHTRLRRHASESLLALLVLREHLLQLLLMLHGRVVLRRDLSTGGAHDRTKDKPVCIVVASAPPKGLRSGRAFRFRNIPDSF